MTDRVQLTRRLTAVPLAKARVLAGLSVGICLPYFFLQGFDFLPVRAIPEMFLDRIIPFAPGWTPIYLSICVLVPLSVLLADREPPLRAFSRGLILLCVVCFSGFVLVPATGPRPDADVVAGLGGAYPWLISVDGARNAFPSLHAALTIFCLSFALRVGEAGPAVRSFGWLWGAAILYGTLATKQHFALDIIAGGTLGALAYIRSRPELAKTRASSPS